MTMMMLLKLYLLEMAQLDLFGGYSDDGVNNDEDDDSGHDDNDDDIK